MKYLKTITKLTKLTIIAVLTSSAIIPSAFAKTNLDEANNVHSSALLDQKELLNKYQGMSTDIEEVTQALKHKLDTETATKFDELINLIKNNCHSQTEGAQIHPAKEVPIQYDTLAVCVFLGISIAIYAIKHCE